MYNDEERREVPLKTFIGALILIIIFVLLLMWLLPMPNVKGIRNKVFSANLTEMKEAAIPYFTEGNLPTHDGETTTITLQEMIDNKIIIPLTDKNGDKCNTKESYASITKKAEAKYQLKVNLKCPEEQDYIITNVGNYSYCTGTVCEEGTSANSQTNKDGEHTSPVETNNSGEPSCVLYVEKGTRGDNGWYKSDVRVTLKEMNTPGSKVANYGIGTSKQYNKEKSYTVTSDGITSVTGYVKDNSGKEATCTIEIKKDTENPTCSISVSSGSMGSNGKYNGNVVLSLSSMDDRTSLVDRYDLSNNSNVTYNGSKSYTVTSNGSYKIYGHVKDAAGNSGDCSLSVTREDSSVPKSSVPSCKLAVTEGTPGKNGWYKSAVTVSFASKGSTNGAYITDFGIGTSENYKGNSGVKYSQDGTYKIYGYVKDSNGKTGVCGISVNIDKQSPSCTLKVVSGSYNSAGYYTSDIGIGWSSKQDNLSGIKYYAIGSVPTNSNNNLFTVTGLGQGNVKAYVEDYAGNSGTCQILVIKKNNIEYQYMKKIGAKYSDWSSWTTSTYDYASPPAFGNFELSETVDLGKTQVFDRYIYSKGDPFYQDVKVNAGTVTETYCADYDYYRITTTTTTTTYAIKHGDDWVYAGRYTSAEMPQDTMAVRYVFVDFDWSGCDIGCTRAPKKIWDKYTRVVYRSTGMTTVVSNSNIAITCARTETKKVNIVATVKQLAGYEKIRTAVYKDVYKYKKRTRTITSKAYTDYKWSYYNDQSLINAGYTLTGNTRYSN